MGDDKAHVPQSAEKDCNILVLAALALISGVGIGVICGVFRISLSHADDVRGELVRWAHGEPILGFLVVVAACAAATAVAVWLVRYFSPHAAGSGIPHVEAVVDGQIPPAAYRLIPVKFVGGILAIGGGLALGREGPSVQMGASIGVFSGRALRLSWSDSRVLLAAGAGAGLAAAFNAPIAGAIFVLEELVRRFETRIAIAALATSATAICIVRLFIGDAPDFTVAPLRVPPFEQLPLFFVLGGIAALLAVAHNHLLLAAIAAAERLKSLSVEARGAAIGAVVGALAYFAPELVGGGDSITQAVLAGHQPLTFVLIALLIRFVLGPLSYAAATPGGLFAPLLVVGAQSGFLFGALCQRTAPAFGIQAEAFAVVGMAAFFTGVVRAPITGIVLVAEMTGAVTLLLPMMCACFVAMVIPTLVNNEPIYESLREHTLRRERGLH